MQRGNSILYKGTKLGMRFCIQWGYPEGTGTLQKAYVTCHENMEESQLAAFPDAWQPGIQKGGCSSNESCILCVFKSATHPPYIWSLPTSVAYVQCLSRGTRCMWGWCTVPRRLQVLFAGCHRGGDSVLRGIRLCEVATFSHCRSPSEWEEEYFRKELGLKKVSKRGCH